MKIYKGYISMKLTDDRDGLNNNKKCFCAIYTCKHTVSNIRPPTTPLRFIHNAFGTKRPTTFCDRGLYSWPYLGIVFQETSQNNGTLDTPSKMYLEGQFCPLTGKFKRFPTEECVILGDIIASASIIIKMIRTKGFTCALYYREFLFNEIKLDVYSEWRKFNKKNFIP